MWDFPVGPVGAPCCQCRHAGGAGSIPHAAWGDRKKKKKHEIYHFNQCYNDLRVQFSSAAAAAKSLQSCPTLCDPTDGSPPGSPVPGILQARTLEWVAISFSNAWKGKVKVKSLSRVWLLATPWTAAYQASPSMGFSRQEYWSGVPLPSPSVVLIYVIVQLISRTFSFCRTDTVYPLINSSLLSTLTPGPWRSIFSLNLTSLSTLYKGNHTHLSFCSWPVTLSIRSSRLCML